MGRSWNLMLLLGRKAMKHQTSQDLKENLSKVRHMQLIVEDLDSARRRVVKIRQKKVRKRVKAKKTREQLVKEPDEVVVVVVVPTGAIVLDISTVPVVTPMARKGPEKRVRV